MTPKEKAQELKNKFYQVTPSQISLGTERSLVIECTKITVDEIMSELQNVQDRINLERKAVNYLENNLIYWKEVKQELEKL
ncbi:hypothetical protein HHL23_09360 [Chryseobacterium sp. RP-3-3]|uniref:Uncharacterized protein n=1 Tax=Chryseobacterium antibioticum TaxID=2728847 RepID=A0A7Y0AML2_9FLAO|nr:hypothetical protein [Chryseobacterium antibioticum]NML70007.1 hypothetical protein [Chryseobacterium antibioticum]